MSFTGFFLRNRHAVWALVVASIIIGVSAYQQIPVRLFPDTAPPIVNVVTAWPGATASDVERDLTDTLASAFASIEGILRISATSQDNLSRIQLEFRYGTDVRMAAVDTQNKISSIGADLPGSAGSPRVLTFSSAARPVYTVGISASSLLKAREHAEDIIAPRLQSTAGVAAVEVFGGQVSTVLVDVEPDLAESYGISLPRVAATIQANNRSAPAGRLRTAQTETMLRVDQRAQRLEELEALTLALPGGDQLRVGDLAKVYLGAEQDDSWFSINGERAVAVQVYRTDDANTVEVVTAVNQVVEELRSEFPQLTFVPGEESASFTEQSVSNLLGNVWQALLLASVILFFFLGRARAALVTAFTMPLAFALTFGVMWLLEMEFNMVTLSAVILAVGMVVDASVVVLENIVRLRDEGCSPKDAARRGTDEVLMPVLAGVATTLVVLVPLLALPGFIGRVFGPLATTLLIAFSSSVSVALVLVPILSLQIKEGGRIEAIAGKISLPFQRMMDWLRDAYLSLLHVGMRRRGIILFIALLSFVVGIVGLRSAGMNLLPRMDGGTFTIAFETPSGTSLTETTRVVEEIEKALSAQPEVLLVQSQAGFESGMQSTGASGVMGPTQGFISVTLSARTERERSIWQIERQMRDGISRIPNIESVVIKEVGNTAKPTTVAPIVVRVTGNDPLVLDHIGDQVLGVLSQVNSITEPTRAWRRDMRRTLVRVDPKAAAAMGQSPVSIARTLAIGAEGIDAGHWTPNLRAAVPIKVRYARPTNPQTKDRLSWPVFAPNTAEAIPIRAVAHSTTTVEQGLFTSEDLTPSLDILAQVDGRPLNFVVADAERALKKVQVPLGYNVSLIGENSDLVEAKVSILEALAISVIAVYLLLVAQFRSWLHPITVMMAVPLSISGVSLALWITSKPVSMPVMVGLVLLVGTVVNNSILLVDLIRQQREAGIPRLDAITEAVKARFRPIMMTSLSTVIGMLPLAMELALGAERFSPLATAVIGGLLASTLLTLIVIPVLYDVADSITLRFSGTQTSTLSILLLCGALFTPGVANAQAYSLRDAWQLSQAHPAITASNLRVEAAEARTYAATGRLLPRAEFQARATQLSFVEAAIIDLPIKLPDGTTPDPVRFGDSIKRQGVLSVAITQPLFAGGALMQGRTAARAGLEAEEAVRDGTKAKLWLSLVEAWYGAIVADEMVRIQSQRVNAALLREHSLQRLLTLSRATELELSAVALKRAEAQQSLAEARLLASTALQALESLTGRPAGPQSADMPAIARKLASANIPTGEAAEVRALHARAKVAEALSKVKNAQLLPSVALRFGAQYANPNTRYIPLETAWRSTWDASIVLSWTVDAGVRWHEASSARLSSAAAHQGLMAAERQTALELLRATSSTTEGIGLLNIASERIVLAKRAVKTAETALNNGRITPAEVVQREADLGLAQMAEQKAAFQVVVSVEKARALAGHFGP